MAVPAGAISFGVFGKRNSLARFAKGGALTAAALVWGVVGGTKISAKVMDALPRERGEGVSLCFRFLADVRRLGVVPETTVVDGRGSGVRIWAWAIVRATTGLVVGGPLRGVVTRAVGVLALVSVGAVSGQSRGVSTGAFPGPRWWQHSGIRGRAVADVKAARELLVGV